MPLSPDRDGKHHPQVVGLVFALTHYFEESLEVNLPTIWTDEKAEVGKAREEKESEERRVETQKGGKVNTVMFQFFFQCFAAAKVEK